MSLLMRPCSASGIGPLSHFDEEVNEDVELMGEVAHGEELNEDEELVDDGESSSVVGEMLCSVESLLPLTMLWSR